MKLQIDSLVRGKAGTTDKIVQGRVYSIQRSGAVAIIDGDGGKQWIINEPEVLDTPRSVIARADIPKRLRA